MSMKKHRREAINNIGLEATPGTAAASMLSFDYLADGLNIDTQAEVAEINAASTHPHTTRQVHVGRSQTAQFRPRVHSGNIRDLILMGFPLAGGARPTLTLETDNMGHDNEKLVQAVVTSTELTFSRQARGGDGMILGITQSFEAAKNPAGTVVVATAMPVGNEFLMNLMTATVNGVGVLDMLEFTWRHTSAYAFGPPDANLDAISVTPGLIKDEFTFRAEYDGPEWRALVKDKTKFSCVFVLDTGTLNETVTITAGATSGRGRNVSGEDEVQETLECVTEHTGSAPSVEVAYGTAIGASRLGL